MSLARWGSSWPWPLRLSLLLDPWCRSALSFWRSSHLASRASRSTSLSLPWWGLLLRVLLLGAGVTYGTVWPYASYIHMRGKPVVTENGLTVRFVDLRRAASLFPLSRQLRQEVPRASASFIRYLPPEEVIRDIEATLKNDPWAWDLLHNRRELQRMIVLRDKANAVDR